MSTIRYRCTATAAFGAEGLVAAELRRLGFTDARAEIGGLNQEWSKFIASAQFVADWRDVTGFWTMLFMGTRHHDPCDRMMLGMARSKDLETWEVLPEGVPEEEYRRRCLAYREKYQEHGHSLF